MTLSKDFICNINKQKKISEIKSDSNKYEMECIVYTVLSHDHIAESVNCNSLDPNTRTSRAVVYDLHGDDNTNSRFDSI